MNTSDMVLLRSYRTIIYKDDVYECSLCQHVSIHAVFFIEYQVLSRENNPNHSRANVWNFLVLTLG